MAGVRGDVERLRDIEAALLGLDPREQPEWRGGSGTENNPVLIGGAKYRVGSRTASRPAWARTTRFSRSTPRALVGSQRTRPRGRGGGA